MKSLAKMCLSKANAYRPPKTSTENQSKQQIGPNPERNETNPEVGTITTPKHEVTQETQRINKQEDTNYTALKMPKNSKQCITVKLKKGKKTGAVPREHKRDGTRKNQRNIHQP